MNRYGPRTVDHWVEICDEIFDWRGVVIYRGTKRVRIA